MNYNPRHMKRKPHMKLLQTTIRVLVFSSVTIGVMLLADYIGRTYL